LLKHYLFLNVIKRNHDVAIWKWIQKYHPQRISSKRKKISELIVDETINKVGSEFIWLWVAIEPKNSEILALNISPKRETCLLLKDSY
jgi:putative transposase